MLPDDDTVEWTIDLGAWDLRTGDVLRVGSAINIEMLSEDLVSVTTEHGTVVLKATGSPGTP